MDGNVMMPLDELCALLGLDHDRGAKLGPAALWALGAQRDVHVRALPVRFAYTTHHGIIVWVPTVSKCGAEAALEYCRCASPAAPPWRQAAHLRDLGRRKAVHPGPPQTGMATWEEDFLKHHAKIVPEMGGVRCGAAATARNRALILSLPSPLLHPRRPPRRRPPMSSMSMIFATSSPTTLTSTVGAARGCACVCACA